MSKSMIEEITKESPNRRKFLRTLGVATAAVTAMSLADPAVAGAQTSSFTATEVAVLNFALNLEYLEAEFYTYGMYGHGIEDAGVKISGVASGTNSPAGGVTTGGAKVTFTDETIFTGPITYEIGIDERAHVRLIQSFLGSEAIARPNLKLDALGFGFANEYDYLTLARIFEDVGVSAYGGAAHLLTTPGVIQTAARILGTESQHVGTLHTQIAKLGVKSIMVDGADLVPPPTGGQHQYLSIQPSNGLPAIRSVSQVLTLVYGGENLTSGGFFPTGINGSFYGTASSAAATSANLATFPAGFAPAPK